MVAVEPQRDKAVKCGCGVSRFQREGEEINREKIDLTSVISVLILGEKGARSFEREIEILGKIKGQSQRDIKILEIENLSNELKMFNELSSTFI